MPGSAIENVSHKAHEGHKGALRARLSQPLSVFSVLSVVPFLTPPAWVPALAATRLCFAVAGMSGS
jgi:hypothetical protein